MRVQESVREQRVVGEVRIHGERRVARKGGGPRNAFGQFELIVDVDERRQAGGVRHHSRSPDENRVIHVALHRARASARRLILLASRSSSPSVEGKLRLSAAPVDAMEKGRYQSEFGCLLPFFHAAWVPPQRAAPRMERSL